MCRFPLWLVAARSVCSRWGYLYTYIFFCFPPPPCSLCLPSGRLRSVRLLSLAVCFRSCPVWVRPPALVLPVRCLRVLARFACFSLLLASLRSSLARLSLPSSASLAFVPLWPARVRSFVPFLLLRLRVSSLSMRLMLIQQIVNIGVHSVVLIRETVVLFSHGLC